MMCTMKKLAVFYVFWVEHFSVYGGTYAVIYYEEYNYNYLKSSALCWPWYFLFSCDSDRGLRVACNNLYGSAEATWDVIRLAPVAFFLFFLLPSCTDLLWYIRVWVRKICNVDVNQSGLIWIGWCFYPFKPLNLGHVIIGKKVSHVFLNSRSAQHASWGCGSAVFAVK